ncbi:Sec-independent protein translocase protein TatB [Alteripontixanthobacter maritimus]|uniref:Sec-independent protein translocase protein TatB n=1 Tax=Alteripontixanthobacter maritimus TaxID=2161824 RepID=A0A369Q484_9SPHN|nr:Sec-independent protein translocase protein TatB [Alteripontixanthobacter maritimus]RDC59312.1 Sec-independent protein translocase protein TatB [Alteripontixanthobacter maritimus]
MFDIGAFELLLVVVVAILVIGPKDMPAALRTAGRWIGKVRRVSNHFRSGIDTMIREAELEDMDAKWKAQNERIMREHPGGKDAVIGDADELAGEASPIMEPLAAPEPASENASVPPAPDSVDDPAIARPDEEPGLPFGNSNPRGPVRGPAED